jgi:hypothetical protein
MSRLVCLYKSKLYQVMHAITHVVCSSLIRFRISVKLITVATSHNTYSTMENKNKFCDSMSSSGLGMLLVFILDKIGQFILSGRLSLSNPFFSYVLRVKCAWILAWCETQYSVTLVLYSLPYNQSLMKHLNELLSSNQL